MPRARVLDACGRRPAGSLFSRRVPDLLPRRRRAGDHPAAYASGDMFTSGVAARRRAHRSGGHPAAARRGGQVTSASWRRATCRRVPSRRSPRHTARCPRNVSPLALALMLASAGEAAPITRALPRARRAAAAAMPRRRGTGGVGRRGPRRGRGITAVERGRSGTSRASPAPSALRPRGGRGVPRRRRR